MTTEFFNGDSNSSTPLKAQENTPLIVAAAIFNNGADGSPLLLAAERSYPANLAGKWEFPGGKVEEGETPEEALHREIREELGIDIRLKHLIPGPHHGDWLLPNGCPMRLWAARLCQAPQDLYRTPQDLCQAPQDRGETHDSYKNETRNSYENTLLPHNSLPELPQVGSSHSSLRWLNESELESVPWLPGDLQILPSIRKLLES